MIASLALTPENEVGGFLSSETRGLPTRLANLCRLADEVLRQRKSPEWELRELLEREEALVVDSLERLDCLVERHGDCPSERRARGALLGYLEVILRFGAALGCGQFQATVPLT